MMPSAPSTLSHTPATASVWLADIRQAALSRHSHAEALAYLSESEQVRHASFIRPQRQLEFLAGRLLLRVALARYLQITAAAMTLIEQPGRAPRLLVADDHDETPFFSLSHSGGLVACGISSAPIGIDIETDQPERNLSALSKAAFSAAEQDWLQRQPTAECSAAFYRLWNSKEARFKLNSMQQATPSMAILPPMIDENGEFISESSHFFYYPAIVPAIHMAVCSTLDLSSLTCVPAMSFSLTPIVDKHGVDAFFFSSNNS